MKGTSPANCDYTGAGRSDFPALEAMVVDRTVGLWVIAFLAVISLLLIPPRAASAQGGTAQPPSPVLSPTATPAPASSSTATPTPIPLSVTAVDPKEAGLGELITVQVANLKEATEKDQIDPRKFVLYLNSIEIKKVYPVGVDLAANQLLFRLSRPSEARDAWVSLNAKLGFNQYLLDAEVSVGPEGKYPIPITKAAEQNFKFRIYYPQLMKLAIILFVAAAILFVVLAQRTSIIRDSNPPEPPPGKKKPYSLARVQMAWWFFIIALSFVFIWMVTWDYDTLTGSSLVLLGIGTGTALGAAVVDANKHDLTHNQLKTLKPQQAKLVVSIKELKFKIADVETKRKANPPAATNDELQSLAAWKIDLAGKEAELEQLNKQVAEISSQLSKPVSEGFLTDILSDVNGMSFHRFQIAAWTVVMGMIFAVSVWRDLIMPQLSETLLALMGISAGTYIGFKIPERQTEPELQPTAEAEPSDEASKSLAAGAGSS